MAISPCRGEKKSPTHFKYHRKYEKGVDIIELMIFLFSGLDGAHECASEQKNKTHIEKSITIALEVMKALGAKELPAEKGGKFNSSIHRAVAVEELNMPEFTILTVVFRGFQVGKVVYPAHVIVVRRQSRSDESPQPERNLQLKAPRSEFRNKCKLHIPSHQEYQQRVLSSFSRLNDDPGVNRWLVEHHYLLLSVFTIGFDPIVDRISDLYSSDKRGQPPCDPIAIIRSVLLMALFKETSIARWEQRIKTSPLLAIISGFTSITNTPSVGSYYNLFKRLENSPYRPKCPHRILASEQRQARFPYRLPRSKPKKEDKKNEPANKQVLEKLLTQLKAEESEPVPNDLKKRLNEILLEVAVKPSAAKNLLGDIKKLTVCADGSTVPSGAAHNCKRTCNCRKQGIFNCEHLRKFSDLDANWGWDNRKKDWVFGYRYYQFVCSVKKHDLPVYISIGPAASHEAVMSLKALERLLRACLEINLRFQ